MIYVKYVTVIGLFRIVLGLKGHSLTKAVADNIFADYDKGLLPSCAGQEIVNVTLGIALRQIVYLDEPAQIIKLYTWIRMKWNDCLLRWNPDDFNGTKRIVYPVKQIWKPDLTLYDSLDTEIAGINSYNAIIDYDGTVMYNFPTILESLCPIDVTSFPFDTQECPLMFGCWTYNGFQVDLTPRLNSGDLSSFKENVEWESNKITTVRHVEIYGCCPEPYVDITFYVNISRKPAYYIINIITPSIMIGVLAAVGYLLPVESGEKASLMITVMLSMSVFQLLVADKLPPSADTTPAIMIFFNFILGLTAVSTIIQVIVISVHYTGDKVMSQWVKNFIVYPLSVVTMVTIPGLKPNAMSCNKNTVKTFQKDYTIPNVQLWQRLAIVMDRLGLMLFSFSFAVGCGAIFSKIKSQ